MAKPPLSDEPFPLRSMKSALARAEAKHGPICTEAAACREVLERYTELMPEPSTPTIDPLQENFSINSIRSVLARMEAKYGENSKEARAVRDALESYIKLSPGER